MRCPSCNSENPETTKFCGSCGRPLTKRCGKCGTENPPQFKFCGECGSALIDAAVSGVVVDTAKRDRASDSVPEVPNRREGERRHLTVLFCDLVGSTEIAAQLDPEDWRETVAGYQRAAAEAITRFGGHVAKYLGDGVMAFFGYPEAHDNDAERAARAGLAILDSIANLNSQALQTKLAARVGIDSGSVVVGAGAGKDADVFGEAPNIAARAQGAAEPDTVVVTGETQKLIAGLFMLEDRGGQQLKGVPRAVQLYRVIAPSGVRGRLEAVAAARGLTPFVGREDELRLLANRWHRTLEGEGQAVLIVGEAGIGKSRLVHHFREQIAAIPHAWIEAASAPFFQNTAFYPISGLLRELVGQGSLPGNDGVHNVAQPRNDDPLARLESALSNARLNPEEALPLVAPLLNLWVPERYPSLTLVPEEQRRRLLATLLEWVLAAAQVQPLAIVIEDLHWADPSTLELIQLLVERAATAHLLLLCTVRPEFQQQWPVRSHHTQITLNRLSTHDVREMIAKVAARSALANEAIDAMIERSAGVPLFVEELTRAVLESGSAKLATRDIPVTLHDSLMARLDRLGPAKEVLQIGAVIGSEFSYQLLHAVHPVAQQDLEAALRSAADAELVYVRGIAPDSTYQFKHALVRDVAYEALLKSRRKELHRRVALVIDEKLPTLKEAHPALLARHWTEAGETKPAMAEWTRAGKAAESRAAFKEAQESYEQALALLSQLPESRDRDLREMELQTSISLATYYLRVGLRESINAAERAIALSEKSGNLIQLVDSTHYRWVLARTSGDIPLSSALADQTLEVARREGSATSLSFAQTAQFIVRYDLGDLVGAEKHFAAAQKFFDDPGYRRFMFPLIGLGFAHASMSAWMLGRIGAAREREARMMATVDENNPLAIAACTPYAAIIRTLMRDHAEAERLAALAVDLCEKISFAQGAAASRCIVGYERTLLHDAAEGPALIRSGIAAMDAMAARSGLGALTALLAEALADQGSLPEALDAIEQALRVNPDELTFRPELLRIRGELRLRLGRRNEAEVDFREAITMAVGMSAKSWELRATMSLARLRASDGRRDEARTMLDKVYRWFTDGFDTADLKDAKTLLDELNC